MKYSLEFAVLVASMSGLMLGYDAGMVSGLFNSPKFSITFAITAVNSSAMRGNVVAILQAGCAVGALTYNIPADVIGRKKCIILSSWIFLVGSIVQTASSSLPTLLAGRFVTGLGIGQGSMLAPLYIAEIAPAASRGRMIVIFQILLVAGLCCSYWICYGFRRGFPESDWQWRWPLIMQILPALIVITSGIHIMPESIRWLVRKSRYKRALQVLSKLRGLPMHHPEIIEEYDEIHYAVQRERLKPTTKAQEILFNSSNRRQIVIGCLLQLFQQVLCTSAINYYTASVFKITGLANDQVRLLATGLYGNIKLASVFLAYFIIDSRLGRRKALVISSLITAVAYCSLGMLLNQIENATDSTMGIKQILAVIFVYLFAIGFEIGLGPVVWVVCSEIYPNSIRAVCISLTTTIHFIMNIALAKLAPLMLDQVGWRAELVLGGVSILIGLFVGLFIPETRGISLEQMTEAFQGSVFVFRKHKTDISGNLSLASAIEAQFPREKAPSVMEHHIVTDQI